MIATDHFQDGDQHGQTLYEIFVLQKPTPFFYSPKIKFKDKIKTTIINLIAYFVFQFHNN